MIVVSDFFLLSVGNQKAALRAGVFERSNEHVDILKALFKVFLLRCH
jgi:hypothetical protein